MKWRLKYVGFKTMEKVVKVLSVICLDISKVPDKVHDICDRAYPTLRSWFYLDVEDEYTDYVMELEEYRV